MTKGTKMVEKNIAKKVLKEIKKDFGISVPKEETDYALKYIEECYMGVYEDHANGMVILDGEPMSSHDYAVATIANGLNDKAHMDNIETIDLGDGLALQKEKEQEFIEADQETVKKALRNLMSKEGDVLNSLYEKHAEYNQTYFRGELSHPLITIEKMNNRTLGSYVEGTDAMGIANHISFNINFIANNTEERILETLRHEMIHQWQDEVMYYRKEKDAKNITINTLNEEGATVELTLKQKRRPKDWHNRDFKDYAKIVGIPAIGDKCHGNPAVMPEPQSYNRKFICGCVASNGYPVTVWCTRQIYAVCTVCKKKYFEVPKGGKVIRVKQSHVETEGMDAVELTMQGKYLHFNRFNSKNEKDTFIATFSENEGHNITRLAEGVYQKEHNKYKEGYTHWVAYDTDDIARIPAHDAMADVHVPAEEPKETPSEEPTEAPKKKRGRPRKDASEAPKVEEPTKPAKKRGRPKKDASEAPKIEEQKVEPVVSKPTEKKQNSKNRSHKNADDLLDVYKATGSIKGVAEYFGKSTGAIIQQAKELGIDFKKGGTDNE